ncbi:helix-turn-helix domain-containing protein [Ornithinimicrobium avium]|uniref:XRE family transcriptional regulator n=1 Tax=Ornithinimicrobium avium TaxID=2283195 RepID=A0A345NL46_9MICO|nr:XRE family transcriptional regulator [Ornithinimicrobium avium]AXH95754.1 XRE family transcriptional regulator [Ornithinimicrobium avium]
MIGERLKELRTSHKLSLRDLGSATGLSATLLSQIERGVTNPSLKTLRLLADHFGQSISTLFENAPSIDVAQVTRPGERTSIAADGLVHYERVTHGNGKLEVLHGRLQVGEASSEDPWSHEAVECAYVLSGQLTVEVDGEVHTLGPGEAVTLLSTSPHRYVNRGEDVAEYLLSVTPPTP